MCGGRKKRIDRHKPHSQKVSQTINHTRIFTRSRVYMRSETLREEKITFFPFYTLPGRGTKRTVYPTLGQFFNLFWFLFFFTHFYVHHTLHVPDVLICPPRLARRSKVNISKPISRAWKLFTFERRRVFNVAEIKIFSLDGHVCRVTNRPHRTHTCAAITTIAIIIRLYTRTVHDCHARNTPFIE